MIKELATIAPACRASFQDRQHCWQQRAAAAQIPLLLHDACDQPYAALEGFQKLRAVVTEV